MLGSLYQQQQYYGATSTSGLSRSLPKSNNNNNIQHLTCFFNPITLDQYQAIAHKKFTHLFSLSKFVPQLTEACDGGRNLLLSWIYGKRAPSFWLLLRYCSTKITGDMCVPPLLLLATTTTTRLGRMIVMSVDGISGATGPCSVDAKWDRILLTSGVGVAICVARSDPGVRFPG